MRKFAASLLAAACLVPALAEPAQAAWWHLGTTEARVVMFRGIQRYFARERGESIIYGSDDFTCIRRNPVVVRCYFSFTTNYGDYYGSGTVRENPHSYRYGWVAYPS